MSEALNPGDHVRCYGYGFLDSGGLLLCDGMRAQVSTECKGGVYHVTALEGEKRGHGLRMHPRQLEKYEPPKPREFLIHPERWSAPVAGINGMQTEHWAVSYEPQDKKFHAENHRDWIRVREVMEGHS